MDLPKTERGNKHVLVFQDFLTKWPMVHPVPGQKTKCIVQILVKELIPLFSVPEALLSDRGTNLLSYLMCVAYWGLKNLIQQHIIPSAMD